MMIWGLRLSAFLLFRVLKTGKDDRFDDKRTHFFPFLSFWIFQMIWVWTCSLPVTLLNSPTITSYPQPAFGTSRDIAGVVLYAIGLIMESVSDIQKFRFRQTHNGRAPICDSGLFGWSRHPNYFGEIILQFGIFTIAVSPAASGYLPSSSGTYKALYASILGPFFLTILLLFVSGLPLSERPGAKKRYDNDNNWEGYKEYLNRTSILIPFPPQLYAKMPMVLKRSIFLEFPMYVFDPARHSDLPKGGAAAEAGRRREPDDRRSSEAILVD